jgi:hypothetical protein
LVFILRIGETPKHTRRKNSRSKAASPPHESHVAQIENHAQVDEATRYNLACLKSLANVRLDERRRAARFGPRGARAH